MAGDIALMRPGHGSETPRILGGTRAYYVRAGVVGRWFPRLLTVDNHPGKVDIGSRLPTTESPVSLVSAAVVNIDGDPHQVMESYTQYSRHTARTVWLRASSHLLDRVLTDDVVVLREFENVRATRRRLSLIRVLASQVPMINSVGSVHMAADHIEAHAAAEVSGTPSGVVP
ncbi:hypothetical protein H0B56_16985 [Haloechinothrix sp. YIM 98757]|uniref:Uncharacterized protein n=1 Tax=Haloechinothrix aidingensis TaxID=2752311 RepID=A0A838ADP3_9PSEU|nr:hypothetical protein [Haloechinothrix aidingensis]MBA0127248.1 hypothetical protein [Haloechinothrix aidingensis]